MNKKIIILLLIIFFVSLNIGYGGNNTSYVQNPTINIEEGAPIIIAIEGGDSNISFENGYKGYCVEWGEHSAEKGDIFYIESSSKAINTKTHEDVSNYLKIMFLLTYNQTQKDVYATQHMIWKFTDNKQFSRFNQTWYNQIIDLNEKYKIPDEGKIKINETHYFCFDFKTFVAQINEYQNYFAYKFTIEKVNSTNNSNIIVNNTIADNDTINNTTNEIISKKVPLPVTGTNIVLFIILCIITGILILKEKGE